MKMYGTEYLSKCFRIRGQTISKQADISSEEIARIALGCIEDKKASATRVLRVTEATILADYFIICTVDNSRQAAAIADAVSRELKARKLYPNGVEGREDGWWVLLDYGSVIVHLQQDEARAFYDLDNYWGDCPEIELEPIRPTEAA